MARIENPERIPKSVQRFSDGEARPEKAPDWSACLRLAVMGLRLTPEVFWRLSWREWLWLTASPAPCVLHTDDLHSLMRLYPDDDFFS